MPKGFSLILATCIFLLSIMSVNALAQSGAPRVEVGGHFIYARLRNFPANDTGVGGWLTYNVTDNIGIEGEYNYFPGELLPGFTSSRQQALFGVKSGIRSESAGIFFKLRPGFQRFNFAGITPDRTKFALDLGGVFELYPLKRTVVRFDVGDTMIQLDPSLGFPGSFTSHNIQVSAGIGLRF